MTGSKKKAGLPSEKEGISEKPFWVMLILLLKKNVLSRFWAIDITPENKNNAIAKVYGFIAILDSLWDCVGYWFVICKDPSLLQVDAYPFYSIPYHFY